MIQTDRINLLGTALKAYNWRLKALSSNIANLDTPGYQRISVEFEQRLQEVRHEIPGIRDVSDVRPRMKVGETQSVLEDELMNLADTQMRTQFSTKTLHDHFQMLRTGITGRQ